EFDEPVEVTQGNLIVTGPSGNLPGADFSFTGFGTDRVTFTYAPGGTPTPLPNGNYTARLSGYVDTAGNVNNNITIVPFFFLQGDLDGNRVVNLIDAALLERNFGATNGPKFAQGDLDFDDDVDLTDAALLERNFNSTVPPPASLRAPTLFANGRGGFFDGFARRGALRELR
ncbi:MAG: dockerin type I domain-containing protein, partial [Planctomycetota bacterium]